MGMKPMPWEKAICSACWPRRTSNSFNELNVKKIITLSPHGFNALKNEYPALGGTYQVFHYTQVLAAYSAASRLRIIFRS